MVGQEHFGDTAYDYASDLFPQVGPWTLVAFFVYLVLSGKLVPRKELDYWREAFFSEQKQKQQLLDSGRVTLEFLEAVPQAIRDKDTP